MDEKMTKRELKELKRLEKQERERMGKSGGGNATKWIIIAVGSILFLAGFLFVIYSIKQSNNKPVELASTGHVKGSEDAKVTLTEFGDLQCPACKSYEPVLKKTMQDFDGKVKFVYKHFPLTSIHPNALLAAKVSVAAGNQDKFWEMHDWLYENQEKWKDLGEGEAKGMMLKAAVGFKLDMEKFEKDMNSAETSDLISQTQNEGIELGVASTPTFYVNNIKMEPVPPASDYEAFKKIIQKAVNESK